MPRLHVAFILLFYSEWIFSYRFLSYCEIPSDLPVTIACHNAERCWSSSPDKRSSKPYPDFPNLVVVYVDIPLPPPSLSFALCFAKWLSYQEHVLEMVGFLKLVRNVTTDNL